MTTTASYLTTFQPRSTTSQPILTTAQPTLMTTKTATTTMVPVTISLPVVVDLATDMKNSTAEQKEVMENILETLDNTTEIHKEISEIVTFLDDLAISLDNIISLAGMRKRRSTSTSNCQDIGDLISYYSTAVTDIQTILYKLNAVGETGIQEIDDYISTAISVFQEKRSELLEGQDNLEQYYIQQCSTTMSSPTTTMTTTREGTAMTTSDPRATSTTTSSVAAIIAAAEEVKTDTENKISELESIIASLDPDLETDLIASLNTLLSFFNLLSGNLDEIASVSETSRNRRQGESGKVADKFLSLMVLQAALCLKKWLRSSTTRWTASRRSWPPWTRWTGPRLTPPSSTSSRKSRRTSWLSSESYHISKL